MLKLFKSQSGIPLMQGLVFGSIMAGSGLVATRLIIDQKHAIKGAETRDQIDQLHSLVYAILQNKDNCYVTAKGMSGGTDVTANFTNTSAYNTFTTTSINSSTSRVQDTYTAQPVFQVNTGTSFDASKTYMNGNVRIKNITWKYRAPTPPPTPENPSPSVPGPGIAHLDVTYERLKDDANARMKQGYGAKEIKKTIVIRVQKHMSPPHAFDGCYAITEAISGSANEVGNKDLAKELCSQLNHTGADIGTSFFEWHEDTSTCRPKQHTCKNPGEVYAGILSTGEVKCRRLDEWVDINNYIDPSSSVCKQWYRAKIVVSGSNKVKIECIQPRCTFTRTVITQTPVPPPGTGTICGRTDSSGSTGVDAGDCSSVCTGSAPSCPGSSAGVYYHGCNYLAP